MNTDEQRLYGRLSTRVLVTAGIERAPGNEDLQGRRLEFRARDISMTGLCVYTDTQLPAGTMLSIRLEFDLPKQEFSLGGKVIWSAPEPSANTYRTGIHLTDLPEDTAAWNTAVLQTLVA